MKVFIVGASGKLGKHTLDGLGAGRHWASSA